MLPARCFAIAICTLATSSLSNAQTIYSETFDESPLYVGAKGPNDNNISSISFGRTGQPAPNAMPIPNVKFGQFAGTSQYRADSVVVGSIGDGKFAIGSNLPIHGKSRNRTYMTFVDTSTAKVGQYNVSFDVSDFQAADENVALYLHLYEGNNADKGNVEFQVTSQTMLPELARSVPAIRGKGARIAALLVDKEIRGNGRFSLNFGLAEAGEPGDFLALAWSQVKGRGPAAMPSMTLDNVVVARLAAPDADGSTSTPGTWSPQGQAGDWRLIEEVSDEFDGSQVNPDKWNNNPGSWGAWTWDEQNTTQDSGKLTIQMVHEPHTRSTTKLFYKSGILRSHLQMTYGYYEARIKGCSLFPGACPAFWTYSDGRTYTGEVRYCEVDFVELQMNELNRETGVRDPVNHIDMNLHLRLADEQGGLRWVRPNMDPELCANAWMAPWDPREDFHVYGCNVTPEQIIWYIDGVEVAKKRNLYWHLPMNVTLSLGLRHPHIGWVGQDIKPVPNAATSEGFPTAMEVDYVRVWQPE